MSTDIQTNGNWGHFSDKEDIYSAAMLSQSLASVDRNGHSNNNQHADGARQVADGNYNASRQISSGNKDISVQQFEQERVMTRLNYEQQITMAKEFATINQRLDGVEKSALASRLADAQSALARNEQNSSLVLQTASIVAAIKALIPT